MSNPGAKPSIQRWIIVAMIVLALLFSVGAALYVTKGKTLSRSLDVLWTVVFAFLVTWWSRNDRRARPSAGADEVPAFLMFILWPFLLPFQLIKSRGSEGAVLYLGFLGLNTAPLFVELLTWFSYE